jgi:hypothetical protein
MSYDNLLMRPNRTVYRGYAVYVSGADSKWSFRVERAYSDLPILSRPVSDDHRSRSAALAEAKRQIDRLLSHPDRTRSRA